MCQCWFLVFPQVHWADLPPFNWDPPAVSSTFPLFTFVILYNPFSRSMRHFWLSPPHHENCTTDAPSSVRWPATSRKRLLFAFLNVYSAGLNSAVQSASAFAEPR